MEKLNLTQQKHAFTNQTKRTTTQNKHKKTKARFSRLLQHLVLKLRGPVLILSHLITASYNLGRLVLVMTLADRTGFHANCCKQTLRWKPIKVWLP